MAADTARPRSGHADAVARASGSISGGADGLVFARRRAGAAHATLGMAAADCDFICGRAWPRGHAAGILIRLIRSFEPRGLTNLCDWNHLLLGGAASAVRRVGGIAPRG